MDTDPKLRFALLAHQRGLIDALQLAQVCAAPTGDKDLDGAQFMLEREWITSEQIGEINTLIRRQSEPSDGAMVKAPSVSTGTQTPDLEPDPAHERLSQTDELPERQKESGASKKRLLQHDSVTHADGPHARPDALSGTVDFSVGEPAREPKRMDAKAEPPGQQKGSVESKQAATMLDSAQHAAGPQAPTDVLSRKVDSPAGEPAREPKPPDAKEEQHLKPVRQVSLDTIAFKGESRSHYTLSRVHGKGGLGQVWLAIDGQLNREVALKEIRPEKGEKTESCSRLIKEAQITGQLEHPNIIPVYELQRGSDTEAPFYTMRFLRGRTLKERIDEYHERRRAGHADRLELRQLLSIFVDVCNALAYAHSRGVVHRDLKPHNVMLGDFGEVIVIDWGIAKSLDQPDEVSDRREIQVEDGVGVAATVDGKVLGTPAFMAPEQADGKLKLIDARSDIYGLGAILYMILTGHPPHRGTETGHSVRDTMDLLRQISSGPTPSARSADASVPAALDAIAGKAMAKERAQRYSKASELADDIQRWLGDEPVAAYRDPWRERLQRWTRRHRAWTQAAAAALVAVTLVSSVATVFVNRARRAAETALAAEQKALNAEKTALAAERDAKAEATRRFKEARDAVDKSLTGVSGVLLYYPGVQPLRRELLKKAADDYERFANEKSDDLGLRVESGRAFIRLGDVRQLLAQHKEAEQAYRSAESLFDKLCGIEPDNAEFTVELAHARTRLGSLYTVVGPNAAADRAFDAAIGALDKLTTRLPGAVEIRYEKALASLNRVSLLKKTAKLELARGLLEQVEQEFSQLTLADPDPKYPEALGATRRELGQLLGMMGRNDDAVAKLREAIPVYVELTLGQPNHPPYLEGLAATRVDLANALRKLGGDSDAVQAYRTSIDDFEDLLRVRPDVPHYRENLALSRTNLAQVLHTVGRNPDAKVECMAALSDFIDLVNRNSGMYRYHEDQASTSATFGTILRDLNEDALAEEAFRGAIERFGDLAREDREAPIYRIRLAIARSLLGRTLHKMKRHDAAKTEFLEAIETFLGVTKDAADDPYAQDGLAWCYTHLGDLLRDTEHPEQATAYYAKAMALRENLANEPDGMYSLAWFLANCDDEKFRNKERAVQVADEARKKAPENGRYWNMLGMAQYRADKWDDCIKSVQVAEDLRGNTKHASDRFVMAMAQWKKGDEAEAKASFDRAVLIMEPNCPGNIELRKLRREAADLLGISEPAESSEAQP